MGIFFYANVKELAIPSLLTMPRTKTNLNPQTIAALQKLVKNKSALACASHRDIIALQSKINNETECLLSIQTLNRFFGLVPSTFNPSVDTLNILSQYLRYQSYKEFESLCRDKSQSDDESCQIYNLLSTLFSNIETGERMEKGTLQILKNVYAILNDKPLLCDRVYSFMAQSEFGRRYFFEQFINLDALDKHYGQGLNYYLLHARDYDQQFFGLSLSSFRHFLTGNAGAFELVYEKLKTFEAERLVSHNLFLVGRLYANHILNAIIQKQEISSVVEKFESRFSNTGERVIHPYTTYVVLQALMFAEEYEQAWRLIQDYNIKPGCEPSQLEAGYSTQLLLIKTFCGWFAGELSRCEAASMIETIRERKFNFLSEDYFSIWLAILSESVYDKLSQKKAAASHLQHLIEKTGFNFFSKYLDHYYINRNEGSLMVINEKK